MNGFENGFYKSQFYNSTTLNIFSDASMFGIHGKGTGCYGAVAVKQDTIIDSDYRMNVDTTNVKSELRGIRIALELALRLCDKYQFVNILSDSKNSIDGIKSYLFNWRINPITGDYYHHGTMKEIVNSSLLMEDRMILDELYKKPTMVRLFFQPAHVDIMNSKEIDNACKSFVMNNRCNKDTYVDPELIKYLCYWNDYIDNSTRTKLKIEIRESMKRREQLTYSSPLSFHFYDYNIGAPVITNIDFN